MMKKKGDLLISWVLLVGFVVGLAAIVTMWVKDTAEQTTKDQIDRTEQELRCAETALNIAVDCTNPPHPISITNTGKFTITKVKFRQFPSGGRQMIIDDVPSSMANGLPPQQTETLNTIIDQLQEFEALPIIVINEKEVICATRKVTYAC